MSQDNSNTYWRGNGWTAEVVENEDGGGWALAMTRDGEDIPTLVAPWVMGRNKKDPKPLNRLDFTSQVKAANDFLSRSEQQRRLAYRVSRDVESSDGQWVRVIYDVIPDEFDPEAELVGLNRANEEIGRASCPLGYKLTREAAEAWVNEGFQTIREEQDW